jgi:hypothetical protein
VHLFRHVPDHRSHVLALVVRRHHHHQPVARGKLPRLGPVEGLKGKGLDESAEVPHDQVGVAHLSKDQDEEHHGGEEKHRQEALTTTPLEVEQVEERIEDPRDGGEQGQPNRQGRRDQQVQAGDLPTAEPNDGRGEQEGCQEPAEDPEGDQPSCARAPRPPGPIWSSA